MHNVCVSVSHECRHLMCALSVLQCVALCCNLLQCVAVCCISCHVCTLCFAVCCSVLQCVAVCCSVLQCVAVCCSLLQCVASHFMCALSVSMPDSTENATPPKSTKSKDSDFSVQIEIGPRFEFHLYREIPRIRSLSLVDFRGVAFSVETGFIYGGRGTFPSSFST